jgi:dephospho-CoA kinase
MMRVIGLTGGIGSGKSTVSDILAELGAVVIDADKLVHEAYQPGTETWQAVVDAFGRDVIAQDSSIDRQKLGEVAFGDPEKLELLNSIVHPRMYNEAASRIEDYRRQGIEVLVLAVPLLIEADWMSLADELWVTVASEQVVIKRVQERTGLTEEQTRARIRSQLSNEERCRRADFVINNDGTLDELRARVNELWQGLSK